MHRKPQLIDKFDFADTQPERGGGGGGGGARGGPGPAGMMGGMMGGMNIRRIR